MGLPGQLVTLRTSNSRPSVSWLRIRSRAAVKTPSVQGKEQEIEVIDAVLFETNRRWCVRD